MHKRILVTIGFLLNALPLWAQEDRNWLQYTQSIFSVVVLLLVLGTGLLALSWNYKHNYRGPLSFGRFALRNRLVQFALFTFGIVAFVALVSPRPQLENPYEAIEYAKQRNLPEVAAANYRKLIGKNPFLIDYHYEYMASFYRRDHWAGTGEAIFIPLDEENHSHTPFSFYRELINSSDPFFRDLGLLGMGACEYFDGLYGLAMNQFNRMGERKIPYKDFFKGRIYSRNMASDSALACFQRELALGTAPKTVIPYLTRELVRSGDDAALAELVDSDRFKELVPVEHLRYLYVRQSNLQPYFSAIMKDWRSNAHPVGLLGALAGLGIWIVFLRRIDIFKKERWMTMLGTVLLGAIFSFVALPFYDVVRYELGFSLNGNLGHDFLYCIFGIGVIEELVKIIPFLILLYATDLVRGPLNYIIYASLCALGFSFVENLTYFDSSSISIIHGRTLVTCVFHMFASSTIAFGMVLARYKMRRHRLLLFPLFFLLAAFCHGIYDFWLLSPRASSFFFLAYLVFIYATFQYAAYINNCLNHSPFFRGKTKFDPNRIATYLLMALVSILLFEYVALSLVYGVSVSNYAVFRSLGVGSFLMFFVVLNLSYIDIVQGEWFVLRLWNFGSRVDYNKSLGQDIQLVSARENSKLKGLLPATGEIIARIKLQKDNRYFLVEFHDPYEFATHKLQYVLIRARERDTVIEPGYNTEVAVIAIRDKDALLQKEKQKTDFRLLDYALVR